MYHYFTDIHCCINKTRTSKVGAISKAQKAQFLKYAQGVFMKSSENSFKTPTGYLSCSIRLGNHFYPSGNKQKHFSRKNFGFFSFGKCRIVPKNVKGTLRDLITYIQLQNIKKKLEGNPFETLEKFREKSRTVQKENRKRGPFRLVRFCRLP